MSKPRDKSRARKKKSQPNLVSTDKDNLHYINLNFVENSDTSCQMLEESSVSKSTASTTTIQSTKTQNTTSTSVDYTSSTSTLVQNSETNIVEPVVNSQPIAHGGVFTGSKLVPVNLLPNSIQNTTQTPGIKLMSLQEMGFDKTGEFKWPHVVASPKEDLLKMLLFMIKNSIKPNVQVNIGGVCFNCHMMVLHAFSEFCMNFNGEIAICLPSNEVTPFGFKNVYDWMLTGVSIINQESILEIFMAANFLRVKELISQCWLCLDNSKIFREDTAYLLYIEARCYNLQVMEQLMLARVCRFFLVLVASEAFLHLNVDELCQLLSSNMIGVNTEVEVFMAAARWLDFDMEARGQYLLQVAKNVRYSLMPPWFLVTFNRKTGNPEIDRIINHPEIRQMINDGISYSTTQIYLNHTHNSFVELLDKYQVVAPAPRQWVYDRNCTYHHRVDCTEMQHLTYDLFLDYLDKIRAVGKSYWSLLEDNKTLPAHFKCCDRCSQPRNNVMLT